MVWLLQKKGKKYRWWTTISDGWLTDWINEREAMLFYLKKLEREHAREINKTRITFPNDFFNKSHKRYFDEKKHKKYLKHLTQSL